MLQLKICLVYQKALITDWVGGVVKGQNLDYVTFEWSLGKKLFYWQKIVGGQMSLFNKGQAKKQVGTCPPCPPTSNATVVIFDENMFLFFHILLTPHLIIYQVLTECKQSTMFASLLNRLEKKPACKGRSLETFLTYPMHQVGLHRVNTFLELQCSQLLF